MPINNLIEDIQATNDQRKYRQSIGSTQIAKYAYNWWQTGLVLLTGFNELSPREIEIGVSDEFNMTQHISNFSGLLVAAIDGDAPSEIQREYTKRLPAIVRKTGLKYREPNAAERTRFQNSGRPVKYIFYFKDVKVAREVLLNNFPHLLPLFVELDRRVRHFGGKV